MVSPGLGNSLWAKCGTTWAPLRLDLIPIFFFIPQSNMELDSGNAIHSCGNWCKSCNT